MSLRGLVQTVPVGYVLALVVGGIGPLLEERPPGSSCQHSDDQRRGIACGLSVMLSGLCMGLMYELGWDTPSSVPNFSTGTELGELYWGTWSWWMLMLPLVTYVRGHTQLDKGSCSPTWSTYGSLQEMDEREPVLEDRERPKLRFWTWKDDMRKVSFACLLVFTMVLFLGAAVTYGRLKQSDSTNKNQSWIGICQAFGSVVILHSLSSFVTWFSSARPLSLRERSPVKDWVLCCTTVPEELLLACRDHQQALEYQTHDHEVSTPISSSTHLNTAGGRLRKKTSTDDRGSSLTIGGDKGSHQTQWKAVLTCFCCEGRQPFASILTAFNILCVMQILVVACALVMDVVGNWALGSCNVGITASYEAQS